MALKVPWKIIQGSKGQIHDGFSFDMKALFIHLMTSFGLEGKVKQGELEMAITIDGAKLDAKINHVVWGFKLTDKVAFQSQRCSYIVSSKTCSQTHGTFLEQHFSRTTIQKLTSRVSVTNLVLCAY
jgi:hypothetical protein